MRIRLALAAALALPTCAPPQSATPGDGILVIAIDALRYDHLGIDGYDRATSPALDALAGEGVVFRRAYAAAPWQVPAHMALLSSADPRLARQILPPDVSVNQATRWHLADAAPRPAAEFLSHGISTAAFYDHPNLAPVYGYQRGFELYQGPSTDSATGDPEHGSEAVFKRFSQWLARYPRDRRWFAYLEIADLERVWNEPDPRWDTYFPPRPELSAVPPVGDAQHAFFALPRSRWTGGMQTLGEYEARYDGAIRELDDAFQTLRARLERIGRWEDTTIVVVGAYGLSFGESGLLIDSGTFSDCDLHVPLIVRPGRHFASRRVGESHALVSTIDVLPTLIELAAVQPVRDFDGRSFARALVREDEPGREFVQASCAFQEGFAVLDRRFCFERTYPAEVSDPRLSSSWFGDTGYRPKVMREALHDRESAPGLGHVTSGASDADVAAKLAHEGEAWGAKVQARRERLQQVGGSFPSR